MSKQITITGKNNVDKFTKKKSNREIIQTWNINEKYFNHEEQQNLLLNIDSQFIEDVINIKSTSHINSGIWNTILRELKNKISGYMNQDKTKNLYNPELIISLQKVIQLLKKSNLICHYCQKPTYILYKKVRDMKQWTLDRIDNDQGHNMENCVICCLKCNIQRKTLNDEKFRFTKQMKLSKLDGDECIDT
jgi:hypothetical protein